MPRSLPAARLLAPLLALTCLAVPAVSLTSAADASSPAFAAGRHAGSPDGRTDSRTAGHTGGALVHWGSTAGHRPSWLAGWSAAPRTVAAGSVFGAHLRVSGGSRRVLLQRRYASAWHTVAASRSDAAGHVGLTWSVPQRGAHVPLRVVAPGARQAAPVATRARIVLVRPHATHTAPPAPTSPPSPPSSPTSPGHVSSRLRRVLTLVNQARAAGQTCGSTYYPPVRPVHLDARLTRAADRYAEQMARQDFFSHEGPDGSGPGDRIDAQGYRWRAYGENIAGGHDTAEAVVDGWIASPGHCVNLMGHYDDIGLGFAANPSSTYERYWVQDFASL